MMTESKPRVFIRKQTLEDSQKLLSLNLRSKQFHFPWVFPPLTEQECHNYLNRCQKDNNDKCICGGFYPLRTNDDRLKIIYRRL